METEEMASSAPIDILRSRQAISTCSAADLFAATDDNKFPII